MWWIFFSTGIGFMWFTSILLGAGLMMVQVFSITLLMDLNQDYTNPIHAARQLNSMWLPEYVIQWVLLVWLLLHGQLLLALLQLPIAAVHAQRYLHRKHEVDQTELLRRGAHSFQEWMRGNHDRHLKDLQNEAWGKIVFFGLNIVYFMYRFVWLVFMYILSDPSRLVTLFLPFHLFSSGGASDGTEPINIPQ